MTCSACHRPLLRNGNGVTVVIVHERKELQLCKDCGGWDEPKEPVERRATSTKTAQGRNAANADTLIGERIK